MTENTTRRKIMALLEERPWSARQLSRALGIRERDVENHLDHVGKSVRVSGKRFKVLPASCQDCGYKFTGRRRTRCPSRCPECQSEHIMEPAFEILKTADSVS